MKIFLSSLNIGVLKELHAAMPDVKLNVLLTFYGLSNPMEYLKRYRHMIGDIILDCGAYSLNDLDLTEAEFENKAHNLYVQYKAYAKRAQSWYNFVFSFDDDFKPDSFDHNLERLLGMEEVGIKAVPALHSLTNREEEYFIQKGYDIIAIGQCQGDDREDLNVLWPVVDKMYNNPRKIKVHIFGMTTPKLIRHVPVYSCDSKTWLDYGSRGRVLYWNPENSGLDKTDILYFPKRQNPLSAGPGVYYHDYPYLKSFEEYIGDRLHIKIRQLNGLQHDKYRELVNVLYFLELEKLITEEQQQDGIVFD